MAQTGMETKKFSGQNIKILSLFKCHNVCSLHFIYLYKWACQSLYTPSSFACITLNGVNCGKQESPTLEVVIIRIVILEWNGNSKISRWWLLILPAYPRRLVTLTKHLLRQNLGEQVALRSPEMPLDSKEAAIFRTSSVRLSNKCTIWSVLCSTIARNRLATIHAITKQ
jgi:hypothetical protein